MNRYTLLASLWASLLTCTQAVAEQNDDALAATVVDVGPGLCVVIKAPSDGGPRYMLYDAGHWNGNHCLAAVRDIVGEEPIDLMVLSHSDSDHLGDAEEILAEFDVGQIWITGYERWDTETWRDSHEAIGAEVRHGASVINLSSWRDKSALKLSLGDATVEFVAGWHEWRGSGPTSSELRNAVSIVVRISYGEGDERKALLLPGDTVGRRLSDPDSACRDAEAWMVRHRAALLEADVLLAPHHGGNNGSSKCFIEAVDPGIVIFSAGHAHDHPSAGAAARYLAAGVAVENILRTDRGDSEGGFEWREGSNGCRDGAGDDDILVLLPRIGEPIARHVSPSRACQ